MKKQFGKKIWSVLLALVMLLSLLPVSAFADDTTAAVETTIDEQSLAGNNITGGASTPGEAPATDDETQAESDGSAANTNGGINEENAADAEINGENADGWDVSEPVSSYTVSITLPEEGVALADGQSEELLNQTVSAGGEVADIRLVSTYEDEPFESDMADLFNARLFKDTGLTASFGEDGIITIGGTPTADVTVNLADAFADEPATVADTNAIYVSSSGNDSTGDGSQDKPYATISKAYTAVADGGTIYLLSDVNVSAMITFGTAKTVTITSADSSGIKTIYSKVKFGYETRWLFNVSNGHVVFKNITIDGAGQINDGKYYAPGAIAASKANGANSATVTIDYGTTIQNFKKTSGNSGGAAVVKSGNAGAVVNIKDGVMITGCVLETGNADDPASVISSGTGAILYMTGGTVTGNTLSTSESSTTAIANIGKIDNPHFWMTGGKITGNTINKGCAAVYMRGEAKACDIQFGNTAYVYGNYVNGASGDQRNIYLKNDKNGSENDNVFVKLCSALTGDAKLGVYAEMIGMGTKVAQGTKESGTQATSTPTGSTYTATAADSAYFVSDKATAAEILYCGGSEDTCGLLTHSTASPNHEKAIYLSISPTVSASKGVTENTIDATISRCASDATYVVLDKDMKPVTGKDLTGGEYVDDGNGTFKLIDITTTTTIAMAGLEKDNGPYTVMLVSGSLSVGSDGKADTSNLTDIATINIVNFAGDGVAWSDGTNSFENGDFDIVTVPHNDQIGKANKSYTATAKANYTFAAENAITASGNLNTSATATDNEDGSKTIAVEVPAYGTTEKGTSNYNTVTLTGTTAINTDVKLLDKTGGEEMTDGKTYDGVAVAHTEGSLDGATLTYTWQKVTTIGDTTTYTDLTTAPSDAGDYNLKITVTSSSDSSELGTQNLPFTISPKTLSVTATASDKVYDGNTTATLKSAVLDGVLEADKESVSLDNDKVTVAFADKNAGDSKAVTATVIDGALSGDKAGNYTIGTTTAANAKISPATVTASITATSKEYDGSNKAEVSTPTLDGVISDDKVSANASNAVFVGGSGVDNKKTVTADIALTGDDAGNYTLTKTTATATANITAKELGVTVTAENKAYDGTTDAKATVTLKTDGVVEGDSVSLDDSNMKAKFDTAAVGDGKTVTVTGLKLDGDAAKNYKLPASITGTADITKADSGVGTVTMDGWIYGDEAKTPKANSTTNPETDTDKITYKYKVKGAADITYTDTVPTDAGTYTVKATFPANDNYNSATATADFTISPKELNATITAKDKVYDGTNTAEVTKVELTGVLDGETVTATASNAHFAGVNARNDQTVTATITLDNSDAAKNYTVPATATGTASITAKTLTVTATAENKTYDGTTKATITNVTLTGAVGSDPVSLNKSGMTAAFENANVGEDKTVTVSGLALDNNDNGNYKLPNTITTTANITKADGVGTVTMDGWTYGDEANTPTATSTTNPETETNKITYQYKVKGAEDNTYTDKVPTNAGTYTVKATFPANDNYGETTATADFTISPKALTVNVTAANKEYDGTKDATLNTATLVGVETADTEKVTLVISDVSAAFNNENAGTEKSVVLTGDYTLTGDAANNYTVTQPTGLKADINAAPLTISGATVTPKTYDGNDNATVTAVTFDGLKNGETLTPDVDYTVYNAEYDGVNATGTGAAKKANFNVVLTNTTAAKNYTLTTTAGSQDATIDKASHDNSALTTKGNRGETNTLEGVSAYVVDGGTVGTVTTGGDAIFDETPTYDSSTGKLSYTLKSDAAENQTATVTLPVTSTNYNDYSVAVTVGVTPKETVEIGIAGENYVYDGAAHAPTGITVAGNKVLVNTLEVTYEGDEGTTYEKSETAPTNAGKYIMNVKVPESDTKYTGSQTCAFEIAKKPITATITAEDKVYDGNTTATVTPKLDGVVESDSSKVTAKVANPAFEDKNIGENKKVTAAITLDGTAAGNYTVNAKAETMATISVKEVSITGVTVAESKTYDRSESATPIITNAKISGKVDTDSLEIKAGNATYDNANVGTNKAVTFTGFALTGTDASNYKLKGQPASVKADITAKEVTISGVTIETTKVYDGNANAKITDSGKLDDVLTGDTVTIKTGKATYNDKTAGDNKTVTFSDFGLEGADANNYELKEQPANTVADITQREVTISGLSATKTYDGDKTAVKSETTGTIVIGNKAVASDDVSVSTESMTGEFNSKNVDEATTVTISGLSLTGNDAGNYKLPETVTCSGTITKATGSGTVTLDGWTYGDEAKTPQPISNTNGTRNVTYRYKVKGAEDSTYTTTVPQNAGDYTIEATFAATNNYNAVVNTYDFTIAKKALTATITATSKTYDGSTAADVKAELSGVVGKDDVTAAVSDAAFDTADAKIGKTVTANIKLSGTTATNYTVNATATTTANITAKPITVSVTASNKIYDGSTDATLNNASLSGVLEADKDKVVLNTQNANGVFASKNVGKNTSVTVTGYTISGDKAGNYSLTQPTGLKADITARELTVSVTAENKIYDGTKTATLSTATLNNVIEADKNNVTLKKDGVTATFKDKNAGNDKAVTISGKYTISGTAAKNYTLTQPTGLKATITARELTVSVTAENKVYDGTKTATLSQATLKNVIKADKNKVTLKKNGVTAAFNDKNVGEDKLVTISGSYTISGAAAKNYTLTQPTGLKATITAKEAEITGLTASKVYDGDTTADKTEIKGTAIVSNKADEKDDVSVNTENLSGTFDNSTAGNNKVVTLNGLKLEGDDAGNYKLPETVTCSGTITKATGSGTVTLDGWTYGDEAKTPQPISNTNGTRNVTYRYKVKGAEDSTYTTTVPQNAGDYTIEATFAATNNYNAVVNTYDFSIARKTVTATIQAEDKVYDGNTTADVTATLSGVVGRDDVTAAVANPAFEDKNVDESKTVTATITLDGTDKANYTLTSGTVTTTAAITAKALTIAPLVIAEKYYDGTNKASFMATPKLVGVVSDEKVTLVNGVPTFTRVSVGRDIPISFTEFTLSGDDKDNYTLIQPTGITGDISAYIPFGSEYTITTQDWTNKDFVVTAAKDWQVSETNTADGTWSDSLTRSAETGNTSDSLTFYVKNTNYGYISAAIKKTYKIDKTSPTGMISIDERNAWQEFLNTISFDLFYKDKQYVTLTAKDDGSGVQAIEYLVTGDDFSIEQLADKTFTTYANAFGVEPDAKLIVYAKLTDNAGNVTYLRSDGIILDGTAPVISGADNNKTYCAPVTLTITDEYLDTVTLNNTALTLTDDKLTLDPAEGTQTVVATDKAGNSTSITVTVNDGCTWGSWISNGNDTHTRTCQFDASHTETGDCTGGKATCSAAAICEVCGGDHGELDPHNHVNLKHIEAKAATTAAEGNIEYWYCDGCGKYYKDADATKEIARDEIVKAKLRSTGTHTTETAARTGDGSNMTLWLTLMLLSGAGVGATTVLGKRKKYSK